MTREEAREILAVIKDEYCCGKEWKTAMDMAIDALEENESLSKSVNEASEFFRKKRPHGTCKTCKHYIPYREQFSYRNRGDGYCKSTITTSEGEAYINCHDEWYCANYEKGGDEE